MPDIFNSPALLTTKKYIKQHFNQPKDASLEQGLSIFLEKKLKQPFDYSLAEAQQKYVSARKF